MVPGLVIADEDVGDAVAIHIARRAHGVASASAFPIAEDDKAIAAIERLERDARRKGARFPEDHIRLAAREFFACADEDVVEAVVVHIARAADGVAGELIQAARQFEAVAAIERGEIEVRAEAARFAEDEVARPDLFGEGSDRSRPHQKVRKAIAIHIACRVHGSPRVIASGLALDDEARGAIERGQIHRRGEAVRFSKDHVARAGGVAIRVCLGCADDEVREAVAVYIARSPHRAG